MEHDLDPSGFVGHDLDLSGFVEHDLNLSRFVVHNLGSTFTDRGDKRGDSVLQNIVYYERSSRYVASVASGSLLVHYYSFN